MKRARTQPALQARNGCLGLRVLGFRVLVFRLQGFTVGLCKQAIDNVFQGQVVDVGEASLPVL